MQQWKSGTQWANNGGTIRVNAGTTVTLPDASCVRYTGCSFTGWYLDNRYHGVLTPTGSPLTSITLHEDTELCAGWAYNTYTITVTIDGLGTITFAGNDFAKLMADNSATEALGAALYAYGAAAKACFRVPTVGDGMEVNVGLPDNMHG